MQKIIIGARGSVLSLKQAAIIKDQLQNLKKGLSVEIKTIKTHGDKDMRPVPLDSVGKGWFTKEIDNALLSGSIDIAVHSLKDIPEALPDGLVIAAIPQREDARDAFVSKNNLRLADLKKGAIVGTDSTRRKSQLLQKRPDLVVNSLRGNVNSRLEKLDKGLYDGVILAVAGLKRLGFEDRITEYFSEQDMIPSPGQGALAVVIRKNNHALLHLLQRLNHRPTVRAVQAERAFSKTFGGGCKIPVGAYATCVKNKITLYGFVGSPDGKHHVTGVLSGSLSAPKQLGKILAKDLLKKSKPWFTVTNAKYVVITRPAEENIRLKEQLEQEGISVFAYPTIAIRKATITKSQQKQVQNVASFDWILFTSKNGVWYFMQEIERLGFAKKDMQHPSIGVVGPKTAEEAKKYGLSVSSIPEEFTTKRLGELFGDLKGKKILLPRADIASDTLPKLLEKKGARVIEISIYQTKYITYPSKKFTTMFTNDQIACITFTSPSTITGFRKRFSRRFDVKMSTIPVIAIGPVTAKAAKEEGFTNVFTAEPFTSEGLISKIKEVVL